MTDRTPSPSSPQDAHLAGISIIYHYSHPKEGYAFPGLHGVESKVFERHVEALKENFEMVNCSELVAGTKKTDRISACITYDDGVVDVDLYVRPTLKKAGVPAIVFCCSLPLMEQKVLNVQKIHLIIGKIGFAQFLKEFKAAADTLGYDLDAARDDISHLGLKGSHRFDNKEVGDFKRMLNFELQYDVLDHILDVLFAHHFGDEKEVVKHLYMSLDDLRRCQDDGIEIGLHTHSHRVLSRLNKEQQKQEIELCADFFAHHLDIKDLHIAYPYGVNGTWNKDTVEIMENRKLRSGHALYPKPIVQKELEERWGIPRYVTNDVFSDEGDMKLDIAKLKNY